MRIFKSSYFFQIILIFIFVHNIFGTDNWLEVKTKHFEFYGNVSSAELLQTAEKLENFHEIFARHFPKTEVNVPFQTKIIVLKDKFLSDKLNSFFVSADDVNYGIIQLNNPISLEEVQNGYTKFLLENNFGRNVIPAWLFEALGEYFKGTRVLDNNQFELADSPRNIEILKNSKLIPIHILFETDYFSLQKQEAERKNLFRAQSVALLRFLLKDNDNLLKIESFIELRQKGIDERKASSDVFQMNLARLSFDFQNSKEKVQVKQNNSSFLNINLQTSAISEAHSNALIADYFFYSGDLKESETYIKKSLKLEPNQTLAITTLALIKAKQFYYDEAEMLAKKATEIDPNNFLNHYRLAVCLSKRGMTEFGFVSGYDRNLASQIRQNVETAIELNPDFAASYALFSFVNYVRNEELDVSLEMIAKALKLGKGNHQYKLRLAEIYLRKEKFTDARKIAFEVLQTTPNAGVKLYAQNTVQRIDSTEYQLERIKNNKAKYVNDDLVTDNPLSDEEIRKLREKATNDQIRNSLRRPNLDETRVFGSLKRIDCAKNKVDFFVTTSTGQIKIQANSLDGIGLLSLVEEMSDYRLSCGAMIRDNNASIIYKKDSTKIGELISIEFVPKWFKF